ncbi:ATP-binding cassette (ABC) Superfamily [Phytophthora palmivora]|uniref:ATP-binding cassette (ABC) Superfamily n=1 Tax=Phytophthora palmivora TaxID=4796 RepID=A0A2P4XKF3_9STRA|nr:ATP-binding cassette (ABC) Superfamily [Phytophthora palmivora]
MDPRPLAGGHTCMSAYEHHLIKGVPLFIENIEAARCVLLVPHQIPLKEFTRLRGKSETKGAGEYLLSCTGRWDPHTGCPVKELQAEAQLEFILIQQDLRVQFAHLVAKRQLLTEMEVLRCSTQPFSQRERGAQQPSGSLPGVGLPAPIGSLALPGAPPLSDDTLHGKVELGIPIQESRQIPRSNLNMRLVLSLSLLDSLIRVLVLQRLFCRTKCVNPVIEYMRFRLHLTLGLAVWPPPRLANQLPLMSYVRMWTLLVVRLGG